VALTRRVTLRQPAAGSDALGQPVAGWVDAATVWADIRHPSGVESIKAGAEVSVVRASIQINRRSGVTHGWQAVHGATVYDIEAVLPDEVDRQYMFLTCRVVA